MCAHNRHCVSKQCYCIIAAMTVDNNPITYSLHGWLLYSCHSTSNYFQYQSAHLKTSTTELHTIMWITYSFPTYIVVKLWLNMKRSWPLSSLKMLGHMAQQSHSPPPLNWIDSRIAMYKFLIAYLLATVVYAYVRTSSLLNQYQNATVQLVDLLRVILALNHWSRLSLCTKNNWIELFAQGGEPCIIHQKLLRNSGVVDSCKGLFILLSCTLLL